MAVLLESISMALFELIIMINQRIKKFDYWFCIFFVLSAYLCRLFMMGNLQTEFCSIIKSVYLFTSSRTFLRLLLYFRYSLPASKSMAS
jgi:hypothetical protein